MSVDTMNEERILHRYGMNQEYRGHDEHLLVLAAYSGQIKGKGRAKTVDALSHSVVAGVYYVLTDGRLEFDMHNVIRGLSEIFGETLRLHDLHRIAENPRRLKDILRERGYGHVVKHCEKIKRLPVDFHTGRKREVDIDF